MVNIIGKKLIMIGKMMRIIFVSKVTFVHLPLHDFTQKTFVQMSQKAGMNCR